MQNRIGVGWRIANDDGKPDLLDFRVMIIIYINMYNTVMIGRFKRQLHVVRQTITICYCIRRRPGQILGY